MKKEMLFSGKKVTIMGLGLHGGGVGVAKFFAKEGADVLITDLKTKKELEKSLKKIKKLKVKYWLGSHREEDFKNVDLVVKNPAVPYSSPYLKIARENNVPVANDIDIFFEFCKSRIIGVTGTKGKTTTATLIYELLKKQFKGVFIGGNIGISPLEFLDKTNEKSIVVLGLSSFELEGLRKSPQVAVITSIYPDHLDRYLNYEEYIEAKKLIFKFQKPTDFLVLNYDNPQTRNLEKGAKSTVYFFSANFFLEREGKNSGCFIKNENVFFGQESEPIFKVMDINLSGAHNTSNLLGAVTIAKILGVHNEKIKRVVSKFKGVANRQQLVSVKRGVRYINDTTATMPDATISALKTIKEEYLQARIILIAGGQDKKLEYLALAREIADSVSHLILLPGTASDKLKRDLPQRQSVSFVDSMAEAVKDASEIAKEGDIILLSPAAASFNLFLNEFDRGNQFVKEVKKLK
ncbi:UDP-N-acetylmuramoyl-L-alanine--D-glutamate ligase [Patescibacteria group bacterium]|nr:UDP-N-acetylmuramoyl-L-alanine--D-glutamate ligase [Patescibacteria group bacterium]